MKAFALALIASTAACHAMAAPAPATYALAVPGTFARYRTFSFGVDGQPPPGYEVSQRSLEAGRRARQLVVASLSSKGYAEDRANADFIVRLSSGEQETSPVDFEDYHVPSTDQVSVSVDVYEAATGSQVLHGSTIADVDGSKVDGALLASSVAGMLAEVPVQGSVARASSVAGR
jgi:hypothetical protein